MKVVCIVQARMGSTRFPGKVLADLAGHPVLRHVVERAKRAPSLDQVVVAIPHGPSFPIPYPRDWCVDDVLSPHVQEQDLIGRFVGAAEMTDADLIVRLCADNPCVEPSEIDRAVEYYVESPELYISNMHQHAEDVMKRGLMNKYPDGIGCEVFSRSTLQWMHEYLSDAMNREHPHNYWHLVGEITSPECPSAYARPDVRLDVNTPEDLARLNRLYARIGGDPLTVHITQLIKAWDELGVKA